MCTYRSRKLCKCVHGGAPRTRVCTRYYALLRTTARPKSCTHAAVIRVRTYPRRYPCLTTATTIRRRRRRPPVVPGAGRSGLLMNIHAPPRTHLGRPRDDRNPSLPPAAATYPGPASRRFFPYHHPAFVHWFAACRWWRWLRRLRGGCAYRARASTI